MRIYDHGLLWTEMKTTCANCQCVFIYRPRDIKYYIDYDFDTLNGQAYKYVVCPECKARYIFTDPITGRFFSDSLSGIPVDESAGNGTIYDGGDEDIITPATGGIIYDGDDEDNTP